jgi:hypothetical protein
MIVAWFIKRQQKKVSGAVYEACITALCQTDIPELENPACFPAMLQA